MRKRSIEDKGGSQETSYHETSRFSWCAGGRSVSLRRRAGLAEQNKSRRVGIIEDGPLWNYFREHLRDLGDIDGRTITIESRRANGNPDRLLAAAQELARLPVDVIALAGSPQRKLRKQQPTRCRSWQWLSVIRSQSGW